MSVAPKCTISRYTCTNESNIRQINALANSANLQQARNSGFNMSVLPWSTRCTNSDTRHYVASSPSGTICGWLTTYFQTQFGQRAIYIVEISTRRIRDEFYGGIGQQLLAALIEDAKIFKADYIYLFPISDAVASIYLRPEWGFVHIHPSVKHLFYILGDAPNNAMIENSMPPDPHKQLAAAVSIAKARKYKTRSTSGYNVDDYLIKLINAAKPIILEKGAASLEDVLMIIEGNDLTMDQQREELQTFFVDILTANGIPIPMVGGYTRRSLRMPRTRKTRKTRNSTT